MKVKHNFYPHDTFLDEGNINLTPLIDVVFVVLIVFILVAPLVEHDKVVLAPTSTAKRESLVALQEPSSIKISVYADNTLSFNGAPVTMEELKVFLKDAQKNFPLISPQLYHDKRACFGTYQLVKNAVESAGFESLDVILSK